MVKRMRLILLCLLLFVPIWANAAATASLDQHIANFGESVLLTITTEGGTDDDPDFSPLNQSFEILNQSHSSNYSIINGSFSRSKQWLLTLMPKHVGVLEIPAISFGNMQTKPLTLRVLDAKALGQSRSSNDIFLEVTPSSHEVYVQAQLLLTVKLFRAVNLSQAELTEPDIAHAVLKKLGDDKNYETVVDQRRFIVTQRQYAIFPQQDGQLNIPAIQFTGRIATGSSVFAQNGKTVRVSSEPLTIQVLSKPAAWDKTKTWLPASDLSLRELWADGQSTSYKVGEPLTRTIELRATGLTAAQLPTLFSTQDLDGFKQYPDTPVMSEQNDDTGIIGVRQEKVAMIPTRAGELTLPSISLQWWDTQNKEIKTMLIPARVIDVLPATNVPATTPPQTTAQPPMQQAPDATAAPENHVQADDMPKLTAAAENYGWKGAALLFALAWLVTLLFWWLSRQKRQTKKALQAQKTAKHAHLKTLQKSLETACKNNDAAQAKSLLPQWAAAFFHGDILSQSSNPLKGKSTALDTALESLDAYLYSNQDQQNWSGESLLQAIKAIKPHQTQQQEQTSSLKSLYP